MRKLIAVLTFLLAAPVALGQDAPPPEDEGVQAPTPEELGQPMPAQPAENVAPIPPVLPPPPVAPGTQPSPYVAQPPPPQGGQWIFNTDYGWIWAPNGEGYTYYPAQGYPYTYVYEPNYGWNWIVAPWVFGGNWPYQYIPYTGPFYGRYGFYHGSWGWYRPWGYEHGYREYYGADYRRNIGVFRSRYAGSAYYRPGGGYYRRDVYRGGYRGGEVRGGYRGGEVRGGYRGGEVRGGEVRGGEVRGGARGAVAPQPYRRPVPAPAAAAPRPAPAHPSGGHRH